MIEDRARSFRNVDHENEESALHDTIVSHGAINEAKPFTQTIVHVQTDGSSLVDVYPRSAAEIAAHTAALRSVVEATNGAGNVEVESLKFATCLGASVFLWDQPDGGGNSICFFTRPNTTTSHWLAAYPRGTNMTWDASVRSYFDAALEAEDVNGYFVGPPNSGPPRDGGGPVGNCNVVFGTMRPPTIENGGFCVIASESVVINDYPYTARVRR